MLVLYPTTKLHKFYLYGRREVRERERERERERRGGRKISVSPTSLATPLAFILGCKSYVATFGEGTMTLSSPGHASSTPPLKKKVTCAYFSVSEKIQMKLSTHGEHVQWRGVDSWNCTFYMTSKSFLNYSYSAFLASGHGGHSSTTFELLGYVRFAN